MIGCPKFDDAQKYIDKFADIFKTAGLKSVTAVIMEVPCCLNLLMIIKKGMEGSNRKEITLIEEVAKVPVPCEMRQAFHSLSVWVSG